jgi:hypothetical protein
MPTVDFSSGYRDATKGATLKALQKRQDDQAAATALAMKPREIGSMWQGAAQIGDVISGSIREGRLANQEAAGRARFAELLAGGLAPDEIGEAMGLDPETTMKFQERNWAQEDMLKQRGWSVEDAERRIRAEKEAQAAGFAHADTTREDTQTFTAGQTEDAQRHALDLAEKADAAQLVLADHNASIDEKQAAQKVIDEAKVATEKVRTDKIAADEAAGRQSELTTQQSAESDPATKVKLAVEKGYLTPEEGKARIDAINAEIAKKNTPPGLDQTNRDFAKEATDWQTVGASTAASNQVNVAEAIKELETPGILGEFGNDIGLGKTGAVAGALPPGVASVLNPSGEKAAASVQTAVQSSLKLILGSQFAAVEGEQMLKRAFDKSMPPAENARRAKLIMAQLQQSADAKDKMVKYYLDNNYSLDGYQGPNFAQIQQDFKEKADAILNTPPPDAAAPDAAAAAPSEEDIAETMRANNMTREQVIAELARRQGGG